MPSIYELKPRFQSLLRPLVNRLARAGFTANQVTVFAMLLSFAGGGMVYILPQWGLLALPIVLFIRMALNAIDGMLAREHNMQSSLGVILNELGDILSDTALYLPLACIGINPTLIIGIVILAIISEVTGILGAQIGASRRYDGPMGKSDRAFLFGLMGLLLGLDIPIHAWLDPVLAVALILSVATIYNRARLALKEVK